MAHPDTVKRAINEAKRFIDCAENHLSMRQPHWFIPESLIDDPKASGAMKRASMDLTRVLADLRQNR